MSPSASYCGSVSLPPFPQTVDAALRPRPTQHSQPQSTKLPHNFLGFDPGKMVSTISVVLDPHIGPVGDCSSAAYGIQPPPGLLFGGTGSTVSGACLSTLFL